MNDVIPWPRFEGDQTLSPLLEHSTGALRYTEITENGVRYQYWMYKGKRFERWAEVYHASQEGVGAY
jgi:hypothetical protein